MAIVVVSKDDKNKKENKQFFFLVYQNLERVTMYCLTYVCKQSKTKIYVLMCNNVLLKFPSSFMLSNKHVIIYLSTHIVIDCKTDRYIKYIEELDI